MKTNSVYTPSQLVRALARAKGIREFRATRVEVSQAEDGTCVVDMHIDARHPDLSIHDRITLTVEETRAWREHLRAIAEEDASTIPK
jgi:hypothetical protein